MALIIRLQVNSTMMLRTIEVRRIEGSNEPDSINTYRCLDWPYLGPGIAAAEPDAAITVQHRYGDGAVVLASKALAALAEGGAGE